MVCAVGGVRRAGQITPCGRGRRDARERIGRTNPFRMQPYGHHDERTDTGHRMNPTSTLCTRSRVATESRVLNTGFRGGTWRRRASSLPLPRSAGYIGDALSDRVVRLKHFPCEEIESCIRIAFVYPRAR